MPITFDRQQLSPKRLVAVVSALIACYSVARVGVLFFEAIAVVREERGQDAELLELCQRGDARGSTKMREACLKARADRASPLVAKAIVYAVSTAFKDFSDTVGSPFKFGILLLFIISSVVLPVMPWARAFFGTPTPMSMDGSMVGPQHFIVMAPTHNGGKRGSAWRRRLGKHIPMLRSKATIEEVDDESFSHLEPGSSSANAADWEEAPYAPYNHGHAHFD